MFVIPKPGYSIPDPDLKKMLPPEGAEVVESAYWIRRQRDGDVTLKTTVPAPAKPE